MSTEAPYLLDQLETADMLNIDGLHAWQFSLNEALLDEAETAAEAQQPFASDEVVLSIECIDGRERRRWAFSYNQVMEADYLPAEDAWLVDDGKHRLQCLGALAVAEPD